MKVALFLFTAILVEVGGRYGDPYPISGSWFRSDRTNATAAGEVFGEFQSIGGDTILMRGAEFVNSTPEGIMNDPVFADCDDGDHCVNTAIKELEAEKGLEIKAWLTYTNDERYSEDFSLCPTFDKRIQVAYMMYYRVVLWYGDEQVAGRDCGFRNGSKVAVLFARYTGFGDPIYTAVSEAQKKNMSIYLGLPKPPFIREDESSGAIVRVYFQFIYRLVLEHKRSYSKVPAMKGYYSDIHVITDYIMNQQRVPSYHDRLPSNFVPMFWRELYFLTGYGGFELLGSPSIDLTHASNTTLKGYMKGMAALKLFSGLSKFVIRDGRGDGKAAYFKDEGKQSTIYGSDHTLYELLKYKNSSINENTTYADIYYVSIVDFFKSYSKLKIPQTWLMIEAYDDIENGTVCMPVDPSGSGMDRRVHSVYKHRLDQALTYVGAMVQKVTAFAWDPLFTCKEEGRSLAEQIKIDYHRPIISECRFHSPSNQSIVVIGFNIDGPLTEPFQVNYTLYDNSYRVTSIYGYYYELDYGQKHGLIDSLVYIQLYDIPELRDLKREGVISVGRMDGTGYPCTFNYTLNQNTFTKDK